MTIPREVHRHELDPTSMRDRSSYTKLAVPAFQGLLRGVPGAADMLPGYLERAVTTMWDGTKKFELFNDDASAFLGAMYAECMEDILEGFHVRHGTNIVDASAQLLRVFNREVNSDSVAKKLI